MFRARSIVTCLIVIVAAFAGCDRNQPQGPPPAPAPAGVEHWKLTLLDTNGNVTEVMTVGRDDIIKNDVLNQELKYRVNGVVKTHRGSWRKEPA